MPFEGHEDPQNETELLHNLHVKVNRLETLIRWLLVLTAALVGMVARNLSWWPFS